jgi:predicted nucleic acid-binding Zn ribbon protein
LPEQLQDIFRRLGGGMAGAIRNCRLTELWSQVVDERVGKNTEAIKLVNHTLYVSTSSPIWAQELTFIKPAIISRFNERAGEEVIRDIRFKAGGG